jgi:hypothetical protein
MWSCAVHIRTHCSKVPRSQITDLLASLKRLIAAYGSKLVLFTCADGTDGVRLPHPHLLNAKWSYLATTAETLASALQAPVLLMQQSLLLGLFVNNKLQKYREQASTVLQATTTDQYQFLYKMIVRARGFSDVSCFPSVCCGELLLVSTR